MSKRTIQLTETDLKKIIKESVITILKEDDRLGWSDDVGNTFEELKDIIGAERLCHEIAEKLDEKTLQMILKTIKGDYGLNDYEEESEY